VVKLRVSFHKTQLRWNGKSLQRTDLAVCKAVGLAAVSCAVAVVKDRRQIAFCMQTAEIHKNAWIAMHFIRFQCLTGMGSRELSAVDCIRKRFKIPKTREGEELGKFLGNSSNLRHFI